MKIKMIFGPPGTGKTTYLLNTLEKLLKTYSAEEIAFVSFTKKGTYEGKERAIKKFGFKENQTPYFRTLHSIAFKELDLKVSDVISKSDYKDFSHAMGMKFIGYYTEDLKHNDDAYLFFDQMYRNNKKMANRMLNFLDIKKLQFVRHNYKRFKNHLRILDFTDMIEMFINKGIKLPVKVAIVDEAQDLTTLQWQMIFVAFRNCKELYLAGDDDQAIYEWSGADVNFFTNIDYNKTVLLDKSYRLPDNILNFCKRISNKIKKRIPKNYKGKNTIGKILKINDLSNLVIDNEQSWLFLSRNNYFLKNIKNYFNNKGIVYNYKNESSIKKTDIEAIIQYNNYKRIKEKTALPNLLRVNLKNNIDFNKEWYDSFKWNDDKLRYYRDLIKNKVHLQENFDTKININTIHTVKGGEADNVVVLQDITKSIKNNLENNPDSEHRIFYVACTRTKNNLYIMQAKSKYQYNF